MAKKLRNTFWKAVVILSIILMPVWAWGATYYVDGVSGNNSWAGTAPIPTPAGSPTNGPKQTLAGMGSMGAGNTYKLKRGQTYSGSVLTNGNGPTLCAYYNDDGSDNTSISKPIIDGAAGVRCVQINEYSDVTIQNISVQNASNGFQILNATNILLEDCVSTGTKYTLYSSTANSSITLRRCSAVNSYFYIYSSGGEFNPIVSAYDCTQTGETTLSGWIMTNGSTVTLYDCTASNNRIDGFSATSSAVINAYRCISYNNGHVSESTSGDGFTAHDTNTFNCYYCVSYGNYKSGFGMVGSSTGVLYNCVAYNNYESTLEDDYGIYIASDQAWTVKNCATSNHRYELYLSGSGTYTLDNNCYYDSRGGATPFHWKGTSYTWANYLINNGSQDTHSFNADPKFKNAAGADFRLNGGSPCFNTGSNAVWSGTASVTDLAGFPITDASGNITAFMGTVDIGAYEWIGGGSGISQGLGLSSPAPKPQRRR